MNNRSYKSPLAYIVVAGIVLGVLAGMFLYLPSPIDQVRADNEPPNPSPQTKTTIKDWTIPTRTSTVELSISDVGQTGVKVGSIAPDFLLQDRSGNPIQLFDLRGKVIVINFWASWCPPCRYEMPDLQSLWEEYEGEDLIVLGVNTTYIDIREDALAFIDELDLTFPIVFDEAGTVSEEAYRVIGLPTSFWIDREGVVHSVKVGAMTYEEMSELADQLQSP